MRVFLRTFNRHINSKTGAPLPSGQYRGTPEWIKFQNILIRCIDNLGCPHLGIDEGPNNPIIEGYDKYIYVHQNKREYPNGDLFWMQMHFRELFTIDTNGWGADHSGNGLFNPEDIDEEEAIKFCQEKSKEIIGNRISKCDQSDALSDLPASFILVPLQIPRDYTIKHHSPISISQFIESLSLWASSKKVHVCFKMHPHNKHDQDLHNLVNETVSSSNFIHKVEGNIHDLITRSDGVFVINSGTGFEALVHGKPVATFGNCDYRRATFEADIRRIDEAFDFVRNFTDGQRGIGYRMVLWYWMRHAFDVNDPKTPARLTEYLKGVL